MKSKVRKKTKITKQKINKNMSFAELIRKFPESVEVLAGMGMHCIGCPMSMYETLEQGCCAHGLDVKKIINELNKKLRED